MYYLPFPTPLFYLRQYRGRKEIYKRIPVISELVLSLVPKFLLRSTLYFVFQYFDLDISQNLNNISCLVSDVLSICCDLLFISLKQRYPDTK